MDILSVLKQRYTCKRFNVSKKLSLEQEEYIQSVLQLSASSTNLQPWHFIIAHTSWAKERFAKATQDFYAFNASKVLKASHVVAFCAKTEVDDDYIRQIDAQEEFDGRFKDTVFKEQVCRNRMAFAHKHKEEWGDMSHWLEKQVYLNMGSFMLAVAAMGLDATIIEGFDKAIFNQEFGLDKKGLQVVAMIAVGFAADEDFNAKLPKSRLPKERIIECV